MSTCMVRTQKRGWYKKRMLTGRPAPEFSLQVTILMTHLNLWFGLKLNTFFFLGGMHPAPWMPIITSADACVAPCWTGWKTQWAQRAQRLKPTAAGWRACCRLRLSGLSRSGLGRLGRLGLALFLAQLLCAPDDAWSDHRGSGCV